MGKSLTKDERKNSSYTKRNTARRQKEEIQTFFITNSDTPPKINKTKTPYRSHNDSFDD